MSPEHDERHNTPVERRACYGRRATDGPPIPLDAELVEVLDTRRKEKRRLWKSRIAYGALVLALLFIFARLEAREHEKCVETNRAREAIRAFVIDDRIRSDGVVTDREEAIIRQVNARFPIKDCPPAPWPLG